MFKIESLWYEKRWRIIAILLLPFAFLFACLSGIRRYLYQWHVLPSYRAPVPVIIIGNITIGGTGKTPFVLWLSQQLKRQGYKVGIVSRGVGGKERGPCLVQATHFAEEVGDEAKLLAEASQCPVAIGVDRVAALQLLQNHHYCDVILSDDGLQHYRMQRDLEIVMIDETRQFGNGFLLPAGPLRELPGRLQQADFVIRTNANTYNGMQLQACCFTSVKNPSLKQDLHVFLKQTVHAVAGIGHPQRFFNLLNNFAQRLIMHPFADHHAFKSQDLQFDKTLPVIMTAKDAVKCHAFAEDNWWYLEVTVKLQHDFEQALLAKINSLCVKKSFVYEGEQTHA